MIASLFMYCYPQLIEPNNRYWALIRSHLSLAGIASPQHLKQIDGDTADWQDTNLVFSQTCGMPYRLWLHENVQLIGTPDYGLDACPPGYYRSALVVRADDPGTQLVQFEGATLAFNSTHSQSGYAAPYWHARAHGFWFRKRIEVGSHLQAARAVAAGDADIAALDALSWKLMQRYCDFSPKLRVLDWTTPTPGLPYISASDANTSAMFDAIACAIDDLSETDAAGLAIKGLVKIGAEQYLGVENPP